MIARLALAALATGTARAASLPSPQGAFSYNYTTEAPSAAPTSSMAPTRTETYAPTRMTEAPSYAPTTERDATLRDRGFARRRVLATGVLSTARVLPQRPATSAAMRGAGRERPWSLRRVAICKKQS